MTIQKKIKMNGPGTQILRRRFRERKIKKAKGPGRSILKTRKRFLAVGEACVAIF